MDVHFKVVRCVMLMEYKELGEGCVENCFWHVSRITESGNTVA